MTKIAIGMLTAAFAFAGCADAPPTLETDSDRKVEIDPFGCRIERYSIHSPSMNKPINIAVVLPPGYDEDDAATYPVIYTLHGARAPYDTFANMSRFRKMVADMPMIYTCFEAELSSYLDWPSNPEIKYSTFFFDEFIPHIESTYRTNGQRGVTGFSMGGSGAMYYALARPEMFGGVCAMSTGFRRYADPTVAQSGRGANRFGDWETHKEFYLAIDPFERISRLFNEGTKLPRIMLRSGTEDRATIGLRAFRDHLITLNQAKRDQISDRLGGEPSSSKDSQIDRIMDTEGISFIHVETPGRHAWPYWHAQAPDIARFFWEVFQQDANSRK